MVFRDCRNFAGKQIRGSTPCCRSARLRAARLSRRGGGRQNSLVVEEADASRHQIGPSFRLDAAAAADNLQKENYDSDDQQDVDVSADRVEANQTNEPKNH